MAERLPYHELVARKLEAHPELLAVGRQNVERWLANGAAAVEPLLAWDRLLANAQQSQAGLQVVLALLRSGEPVDERLAEFAPFAGLLTREERRTAKELCGFRH